ncbi:MAG: hypothetical protein KW788_00020 [Candidatus Doudnabacteria bacterium]|nr:hypothetical protein [Candidatus Doudnabacteria bacterium]
MRQRLCICLVLVIIVVFASPGLDPSDGTKIVIANRWGYQKVEFSYEAWVLPNPDGGVVLTQFQYLQTRVYLHGNRARDIDPNSAEDQVWFAHFCEILREFRQEVETGGEQIAQNFRVASRGRPVFLS